MPDPTKKTTINPGSFRDPSGFIFTREETVYRQVNKSYQNDFDLLISSGLYQKLIDKKLLVSHDEVEIDSGQSELAYKIIRPEQIPFISYPYEWSFSQLKDAALTTLRMQGIALKHGMSLKDASAYNIQFIENRPVMIDTLSFETYREGSPWVAYKQFCQHFLAPLALMSRTDIRLSQLLRVYIDGIPLDLASKLLPVKTKFSFSILTHIHLHAKSQSRYADRKIKSIQRKMSKQALLGIIDNLKSIVKKLKWKEVTTTWGDYYDQTNYSSSAAGHKGELVKAYLEKISPANVWDLGANTGIYSMIAAEMGIPTVAYDIDPVAVEKNYLGCKQSDRTNMLPLLLDLTNPSPDLGWENRERPAALKRSPGDTAMALALIHHLAIANNLPLPMIARFFTGICKWLIIEFVPKSDSQTQRLLGSREDIFPNYTQDCFETAFREVFDFDRSEKIRESERTLYLMHKR